MHQIICDVELTVGAQCVAILVAYQTCTICTTSILLKQSIRCLPKNQLYQIIDAEIADLGEIFPMKHISVSRASTAHCTKMLVDVIIRG